MGIPAPVGVGWTEETNVEVLKDVGADISVYRLCGKEAVAVAEGTDPSGLVNGSPIASARSSNCQITCCVRDISAVTKSNDKRVEWPYIKPTIRRKTTASR